MPVTATATTDFGTTAAQYFRARSSAWDAIQNATRVDFHGYASKDVADAMADAAPELEARSVQSNILVVITPDGKSQDVALAETKLKEILAAQGATDIADA